MRICDVRVYIYLVYCFFLCSCVNLSLVIRPLLQTSEVTHLKQVYIKRIGSCFFFFFFALWRKMRQYESCRVETYCVCIMLSWCWLWCNNLLAFECNMHRYDEKLWRWSLMRCLFAMIINYLQLFLYHLFHHMSL